MTEVHFYGWADQGADVASELLARAAAIDGLRASTSITHARGGLEVAICVIDGHPSEATAPDHVVVLDQELVGDVDPLPRPGGSVVMNTTMTLTEVGLPADQRVVLVDATGIALRHGFRSDARAEVPVVMLGALARVYTDVSIESIVEAVRGSTLTRTEQRAAAAMDAYQLWDWL